MIIFLIIKISKNFKNLYKHHNDNKYKKRIQKIINYFVNLKQVVTIG